MWRVVLFVIVLSANIKGLQITSLQVPPFVVNNSGLVVLDCQYSLTPVDLQQDSGLVVKWFFNNGPAPVFQWIPGQRPQDLGILKGRLDLDYQVSNDNATMYRALSLVNPTTELSGEYRCAVSTFADEDFMIQKMIVYAPEKHLELLQEKPTYDSVNISCSGFGLYPEPRIALYKDPYTPRKSEPLRGVTVETSSKHGHYDIVATSLFQDADLSQDVPTTFICEVCIPTTEYCRSKRIVYYPGTPLHRSMASYYAEGCGVRSGTIITWVAILSLLVLK